MVRKFVFNYAVMIIFAGCQMPKADIIIRNAHILDCDGERNGVIAIKNGKIISAESGNEEIDAGGATVLPGLIDAHGHPAGLGAMSEIVDLTGVRSLDEILERVKSRLGKTEPGGWIVGRGWNNELWADRSFPNNKQLSEITPDNPVLLERVDGHAALANKKALEIAGVTSATADPSGGDVLNDADGTPTGMLIDNAVGLVERFVQHAAAGSTRRRLLAAQGALLKAGIVETHDAGVDENTLNVYKELDREGLLKIRFYVMFGGNSAQLLNFMRSNKPFFGKMVTVRAVKVYADGALGSRGALLLQPYSDNAAAGKPADYRGLPLISEKELEEICTTAIQTGYQVCTHAIGDGAVNMVINAYEKVLSQVKAPDLRRFRIEHLQVICPSDIARLEKYGIIASMQPVHATSDMVFAENRLGTERTRFAYCWKKLLDAKVVICGGSDYPVEDFNPLPGLYAAVTRCDKDGKPEGGWYPENKVPLQEAIRMFTTASQFAAFESDDPMKPALVPGMPADVIILDRKISNPGDLLGAKIRSVLVAGKNPRN